MKKKVLYMLLSTIIFICGIAIVYIFNSAPSNSEYQLINRIQPFHYNGKKFAGSKSCIPCHESIYKTHISTAHFNTSVLADGENLLGSFNLPQDRINLVGGQVKMVKESGNNFQITQTYSGKILDKSKIDIVVGSGVKGQSHLTFKGDSLYQLQASYFKLTEGWVNSPGFPNQQYQRLVMDNCIKCHVTFAKNEEFSGMTNVYKRDSFIYGIDCERCHGPSQEHVDFRMGNLKVSPSDSIVQIRNLSRERQNDVCAQCHAGLRSNQVKGNPFSFVAGDTLEEFSKNYNSSKPEYKLDVHGNQYGLLKSSACFKNSPTMSCTTCHNVHLNQRGQKETFNAKCMECHREPENLHSEEQQVSISQNDNCIKCHMPVFTSKTMNVSLLDKSQKKDIKIRTHLIGVYVDNILQKTD